MSMNEMNQVNQVWDKHLSQLDELEQEIRKGLSIPFKGRQARALAWGLEEPVSVRVQTTELIGLTRVERVQRITFPRWFDSPEIQASYKEAFEDWDSRRKAVLAAARAAIDEMAEELARSPHFDGIFAELHYFVVLDEDLRKKLLGLNEKFKKAE